MILVRRPSRLMTAAAVPVVAALAALPALLSPAVPVPAVLGRTALLRAGSGRSSLLRGLVSLVRGSLPATTTATAAAGAKGTLPVSVPVSLG